MASGTISAMNSSIRYNASLRRYRRDPNKFSKKTLFKANTTNPLSRSENLRIRKENQELLAKKTKTNRFFGVALALFYGAILCYVVLLLM